jgi:hypothetical protein
VTTVVLESDKKEASICNMTIQIAFHIKAFELDMNILYFIENIASKHKMLILLLINLFIIIIINIISTGLSGIQHLKGNGELLNL